MAIKPRTMKIEADPQDIVEMVRGAFEPVETQPSPIPTALNYPKQEEAGPREMPQGQYGTRPEETAQEPSALDRLKKLYETVPTTENQKPSKLRRFGAAVAGGLTGAAGGPEVGMKVAGNIIEAPYREAYQDWLTKSGALKDQAELENKQQQAENSGMSAYASMYRARTGADPELQGDIAGARTTAQERARQPGREALADKNQAGRMEVERIRDLRAEQDRLARGETANKQINSREKISDAQIKAAEERSKREILSRENAQRMANDLKREMAAAAQKNQRITPSQQYLGRIMAENELAKTVSDPAEFEALFEENTDSQGRKTYQLKPENQVPAIWKKKRDEKVKDINTLLSDVLKSSYNPSRSSEDQDEEELYGYESLEDNDMEE